MAADFFARIDRFGIPVKHPFDISRLAKNVKGMRA